MAPPRGTNAGGRFAMKTAALLAFAGCGWVGWSRALEVKTGGGRQRHPRAADDAAFLQAAEWAEKSRLNAEDTLPLTADATFDVGVRGENGSVELAKAGRGSYIADFGLLDVPWLGELRARAGLRYSRLYPRGALELGFRKELRSDAERGYQLFVGAQTAGDDRRLDVLMDVGALKQFRSARAFYRFLWGVGWPFSDDKKVGPGWNEMGSSLGVTQQDLPPFRRGELTVGWRTGLFDNGLEGVGSPTAPDPARKEWGRKKPQALRGILDSTPYASYAVGVPLVKSTNAQLSWTILPEHDTLEYALQFRVPEDETGGTTTVSAVLDQSMRNPARMRLRLGGTYTRG